MLAVVVAVVADVTKGVGVARVMGDGGGSVTLSQSVEATPGVDLNGLLLALLTVAVGVLLALGASAIDQGEEPALGGPLLAGPGWLEALDEQLEHRVRAR